MDSQVYNRSFSSITVNRLMTGLTGNSQGTLIAGLWGPYNRPLSYPRIVPPHGTVNPFQITIINQVPQSLVNKMAMAFVAAITSNGQDQGGNVCGAAVVP